jgi:hypothetical protein
MIRNSLTRTRSRSALALAGMLVLLFLFLYLGSRYILTRSLLVPAWSVPSSSQANSDDWVTIDLISPTTDGETLADTNKVVLHVQYSLQSKSTATLLIQLRSRLDLDRVDRGTEFSNLLARYDMQVQKGTGEESVELTIEPGTLIQFPPSSQILPIASLQETAYPSLDPSNAYFYQVFEDLALQVPDLSRSCVFDENHESLQITQIISPSQFSEATPKAQVIVEYTLLPSHAEVATLVGGFVNPTSDGEFADFDDWKRHTGTWQYQDLETPSGTIVLDLYSWFPTEDGQQIIDENNQVALALGLVCGWDSHYTSPRFSYSKVFPEYTFTFSSELLGLTPTPVPFE